MIDRLAAIDMFRAVVERGGFAAAATGMGVSKATVSKQIAALEAHLGTQLLHRTTRRLALTEAGERFLIDTSAILSAMAEAEARAGNDQTPRGLLRVNAPLTYGVTRLMPVLARMMRDHADLSVELELDDRRRDPVGEAYDVTIRIAERLNDSKLVARRIGAIDHVICAAPDYLARRGEPDTPADLTRHSMLVYAARGRTRRYRFTSISNSNAMEVDVAAALSANTTLALRAALLDGAGIAVTPLFAVEHDLAAGRLQQLLRHWRLPEHSVHALIPGGSYVPAKTRRFIDLLLDQRDRLADDGLTRT